MNKSAQIKSNETEQQTYFIELSSQWAEMAARDGIKIVPFKDPSLPYFSAASYDERENAIKAMSINIKLAKDIHDQDKKLDSAKTWLWAFSRAWKYRPTWDFGEKINDDDMVDVYNDQGQLIFANLRFYDLTSYSLEELYFRPWPTLFSHEPAEYQTKLKAVCDGILAGPHQLYDVRHLGEHMAKETQGDFQIILQPTYFSSLAQNRKIVGYICANRVINVARK